MAGKPSGGCDCDQKFLWNDRDGGQIGGNQRATRNDLAVHTSHIYPKESNICEEKCPRIIVAAFSIAAQNCISINREMVKFNTISLF